MPRPISKVAPQWWDYTTLDEAILQAAARLTPKAIEKISRPGFTVGMSDTPPSGARTRGSTTRRIRFRSTIP